MNQQLVESINREVYRRFPEVKGSQPKVRARGGSNSGLSGNAPTYLLTYQIQAITSLNKTMPRLVRVVVDEKGKIIKISTSR